MSGLEDVEVRAAGCVVHRPGAADGGVEVAVVHRPHYDDWSLPKGKLDAGESWEEAAVREVQEEMGARGELGAELRPVFYTDRKGRSKAVRYWLLADDGTGGFEANDEVDEVRWLPIAEALERLSYDTDRETVAAAAEALG